MKKFWLSLGLTLVLVGWGWEGSHGLGTRPVHGQPPPYYGEPSYCDPNYYTNCYSAPYVDPNAQFFLYWAIPQIEGQILEHRGYEQGREGHERYEHRGHEGHEGHERGRR